MLPSRTLVWLLSPRPSANRKPQWPRYSAQLACAYTRGAVGPPVTFVMVSRLGMACNTRLAGVPPAIIEQGCSVKGIARDRRPFHFDQKQRLRRSMNCNVVRQLHWCVTVSPNVRS